MFLSFSFVVKAQTVSFNAIPTINCPSGNMYLCGTYAPPATGGPYSVTFNVDFFGALYVVTGGEQYLTTLTPTTFCLTIPASVFNLSPFGNYEVYLGATFTQLNAPFAEVTVTDAGGTNDFGPDIFYSNTCPIVANDDGVIINQCNAGSINVFANDIFFGNPANNSNVVLTQLTTLSPVTLNASTGIASIPAGTQPGTYNITYQICNSSNSSQCDNAIVSFIVNPAPIVAANDSFSVNTCTGGNSSSVLLNDTICGSSIATPVTVSFSGTPAIVGATISNAGIITIPSGTPIGNYSFTYNVCHSGFATSCSSATVNVNITGSINAVNDNFNSSPINSLAGGVTPSILLNDTLNGTTASSSTAIINIVSINPPLLTSQYSIANNGVITFSPGIGNGIYTVNYCIRQVGCLSNVSCATVTVTFSDVIVTPTAIPGIRANNLVTNVDTQTNNKIIISGYFSQYNNVNRLGIARLNDNLTLDVGTTLVPVQVVPYDMKVIKNGGVNLDKILIAGSFGEVGGSFSNSVGIARLLSNGNLDTTFNSGFLPTGAIRGVSGSNAQIRVVYVYPDNAPFGNAGKILIGGMFTHYNGVPREKIARLMPNGALDPSFNANDNLLPIGSDQVLGFNSTPQSFEVQPDGRILVGGFFTMVSAYVCNKLVRLENNGLLDPSFNQAYIESGAVKPGVTGQSVQEIVLQPDGKIIIAGFFSLYNALSRNSIARLLPSGALDITFNPGTGFFPSFNNITPAGISTEPPGMIRSLVYEPAVGATPAILYVSGDFTRYNNLNVQKVIAINCGTTGAGGRNNSFRVGPNLTSGGPNDNVWSMKKQGAKIIIGGKFTSYNGLSAMRVTRIFPTFDSFQSNELRGAYSFYDSEPEIDISLFDKGDDYVIYPNPSEGFIKVLASNKGKEIKSVQVYNHLGQMIIENNFENHMEIDLDLTTFTKGLYFVIFNNDKSNVKKIIIQ